MHDTCKIPQKKQGKSLRTGAHRLKSISVIGGFLNGVCLDLSDGLNCLIGARGTGKTTALELVRFGMDELPTKDTDAAERRRIESLIQQNLNGGQVEIEIETKEGLGFVVSRAWGEEPIVLTRDGKPTEMALKSGAIFRADVFSQNEVERIADEAASQLALLDSFDADAIAQINMQLKRLRVTLDTNATQVAPAQRQLSALAEELRSLPAVEAKLKAHATTEGDNSNGINRAHSLESTRDREQRLAAAISDSLSETVHKVTVICGRLQGRIAGTVDREMAEGPNGEIVQAMCRETSQCGDDLDRLLTQAEARIQGTNGRIAEMARSLALAHKEQEVAFRNLMAKHQEAQGQAAERAALEKTRNDLLAKERQRADLQERLAGLQIERTRLLERLSELQDARFALRRAVAERINNALSPAIRVTVIQHGNPELYRRKLERALRGARVRHGLVAGKLVGSFWPTELVKTVAQNDAGALVDQAGLSYEQAEKVVAALSGSEAMFEFETIELLDRPQIELRDGEHYKDCATLSTGQKCTAILPILFMDSDRPLLIDQPEDNLDNRFIFETVVDSLRKIKRRRQLVFVTHNPNIPVLGDAEKVFVLESDGSAARKVNEGTVDECKLDIVTLLEGGVEAFKRRRARYAY